MSWDTLGAQVSRALSALQAKECSLRGTSTTLEIAIAEAIVDLDSARTVVAEALVSGGLLDYSVDGAVRPGQLQTLDQIEAAFFGDPSTGQQGLLDAMRDLPEPDV